MGQSMNKAFSSSISGVLIIRSFIVVTLEPLKLTKLSKVPVATLRFLQSAKLAESPSMSTSVTVKFSIFSTPDSPKYTNPLNVPVATFKFLQLSKSATHPDILFPEKVIRGDK